MVLGINFNYMAHLRTSQNESNWKDNYYMIVMVIFFSLPVGPVDIVAFAVCLDCGNVSKKR